MAYAAKRDLLKAGKFVGIAAYLTKVSNVQNGGTVAISGDWIGLPSMKAYTTKRKMDSYEIEEQTGTKTTRKTLLGYDLKTVFNQRDAATYELDQSYVGAECVLLVAGHRFGLLSTKAQQWIAIFGEVVAHEDEINSADGAVPFLFSGLINAQAITLGTAQLIAYPSDSGITAPLLMPNGTMTIAANGGYKLADIADS